MSVAISLKVWLRSALARLKELNVPDGAWFYWAESASVPVAAVPGVAIYF